MLGVRAEGLCKRFPDGTQALDEVGFGVEPGEGVVLLGPNGSGKSTLLKCVTRLEEADSGSARVGELDTLTAGRRELRDVRRRVGMIFQQFHLVGNLSVFHNALHGALGRSQGPRYWLPSVAPKHERLRVMECLERVGLDSLAARRAYTLSGGQQQRVALARMLVQDPELVLADEPVASLDPKAGREVMDLLWEIGRERRMTIVCTLHQLDLALDYADSIVGLKDGRVALDRPVAETSRRELEGLYEKEHAGEPAEEPASSERSA